MGLHEEHGVEQRHGPAGLAAVNVQNQRSDFIYFERNPLEIQEMISVVALSGIYLLSNGPMSNGLIALVIKERLRGLGAWLKSTGEAIYASKPK